MKKTNLDPARAGQMSIFIILIFQVLFVLFAMVINIGLFIADKINLQNAVDLGTYYAASKQAEILNAIAHENYQMRQSWKLLAWRVGVLGLTGRNSHPSKLGGPQSDVPYLLGPGAVCVASAANWLDVDRGGNRGSGPENLCQTEAPINLRPLPRITPIAGFNPINIIISEIADRLRESYGASCRGLGVRNWAYVASVLYAFRMEQAARKQHIWALASNLAEPGDFRDMNGDSVLEGVRKTIRKNLSRRNLERLNVEEITVFNSMAEVEPARWLPEIRVEPSIFYVDTNANSTEEGCRGQVKDATDRSQLPADLGASPLPPEILNDLINMTTGRARDPSSPLAHYAVGVEKNPWFHVYVGVKAQTFVRPLFFPIGDPVRLVARAFAKPFGGRIGPWYGRLWPQTAQQSDQAVKPVDALLPPRGGASDLDEEGQQDLRRIPNYSRYVGDELGLRSRMAQSALRGLAGFQSTLNEFVGALGSPPARGAPNDYLTWNFTSQTPTMLRPFEIAAVAPDLFDITYYSIEADFYRNYPILFSPSAQTFYRQPPRFGAMMGDLGSRGIGAPGGFSINVEQQIDGAKAIVAPDTFYYVRNPDHLLTAWTRPNAFGTDNEFRDFPKDRFGVCAERVPASRNSGQDAPPVPGMCMRNGGRVGYSVKFISRNALYGTYTDLGGTGQSGTILNPPPAEF